MKNRHENIKNELTYFYKGRIVKSSATLYEKSTQKEISSQGICEDDD